MIRHSFSTNSCSWARIPPWLLPRFSFLFLHVIFLPYILPYLFRGLFHSLFPAFCLYHFLSSIALSETIHRSSLKQPHSMFSFIFWRLTVLITGTYEWNTLGVQFLQPTADYPPDISDMISSGSRECLILVFTKPSNII